MSEQGCQCLKQQLRDQLKYSTLRADIDYAVATAHTTYGALGIKVWVFHGEVLPTKREGGEA